MAAAVLGLRTLATTIFASNERSIRLFQAHGSRSGGDFLVWPTSTVWYRMLSSSDGQ